MLSQEIGPYGQVLFWGFWMLGRKMLDRRNCGRPPWIYDGCMSVVLCMRRSKIDISCR
jgi:hypothetical protein